MSVSLWSRPLRVTAVALALVLSSRAPFPEPGPVLKALPAFPGAEGFGATTIGGRGGRIIYVTTLDDSGPGSLRGALEASGPRIVLFQVAGTITLKNDIDILDPYVTVAGQTAPGEGVQIKNGMLKVRTHDVVIRYLKLRPGDAGRGSSPEDRDALSILGTPEREAHNVIVDHASMVWGPDIGGPSILVDAHHVTIQNSIIGEGLYLSRHPEGEKKQGGHAMGINISPTGSRSEYYPHYITLHHNLITTADARMPQVMGAEFVDVVNNVIYNWGLHPPTGNPRSLNFIKNMLIAGPESTVLLVWEPRPLEAAPELFPNSVYEEENVTEGFEPVRGEPDFVYSTRRFEPYSMQTEETPRQAYRRIVREVGASLPVRDAEDQRIIKRLTERTGRFLNGSDLVWPDLASGPVPVDSDLDGMPDEWELEFFGSTQRGSPTNSSADFDRDGYTDVEEYLNGTDPRAASES